MKNFSDLLDIKTDIFLEIDLDPRFHGRAPVVSVSCNHAQLFSGILDKKICLSCSVDLVDDIRLEVQMRDKIYDKRMETAIGLGPVMIDGIDITDYCYDLVRYDNDRGVNGKTMYLEHNGVWELEIPGPFYRWWHQVTGQGFLLEPAYSISSRVQR